MSLTKKNLTLLLTLILFMGCCSPTPNPENEMVSNQELDKYVKSFMNDMSARVKPSDMAKTTVRFGSLQGSVVGLCTYTSFLGVSRVTIDTNAWRYKTELERQALINHELGHCVCGLGHTWGLGAYPEASDKGITHTGLEKDGFFPDGCPLSLMFPYTAVDDCAKKHWGDYTLDLYNRCFP